ncbi:nuclear transport factor 2 family protein [Jidongwangia harbinensis]|uniref:nuclear transport factor 2 family protein n=1 Tax=Jidongwangia harbinensis TaxID=2878561 RepID=UPI001CD9CA66|nr:nuclear transport factor 2 family protein [Jidongwangia harbinensis]MCA2217335.1 nuclear transport factor 2 family protein [Jidongwangia harbinensis]
MTLSHREIFERYVYTGPISRNADAVADLFTEDGVFEAPLMPAGHALPRRMEGRAAIRAGIGEYHREPAFDGKVNVELSGYVLHETADPDTFICEIDTVLDDADGTRMPVSLVQIYRVRGDLIAMLRDYFAPPG